MRCPKVFSLPTISFIIISGLSLGLLSYYFFFYYLTPTQASWFSDSYYYRTPTTFTHNATITSPRRIEFTVDTATLITAGKMQSDCDDTRFTDAAGKVLAYALTGSCNNAATTYDVVVEKVHSGTNTIYLYYANPQASSGSTDVSGVTPLTPSGGAPSAGSEEVGPAPVAYWSFDEGYGSTAYDSTSNSNNGTITGATWATEDQCVSGKCLYFDGTDNVVTVSNSSSLNLNSAGTITAWVKTNNTGVATPSISSWTTLTNPTSTTGNSEGVKAVIANNKLYYASLQHDTAGTETFEIASSDLDGGNFSAWSSLTPPDGQGLSQISLDLETDGDKLYYGAMLDPNSGANIYQIANSNLDGSGFSGWTTVSSLERCDANDRCSSDIALTDDQLVHVFNGHNDSAVFYQLGTSNLDGSNFSGWSFLADPITSVGVNDSVSTAIDTDGKKIYYAAFESDEGYFSANSALDGSDFSGWTSHSVPSNQGAENRVSTDLKVIGSTIYYVAISNNGATETFQTASSNLDGSNFSGWTTHTNPSGSSGIDSVSVSLNSNGKQLIYTSFTKISGVATFKLASHSMSYDTIFSKDGAYQLIQSSGAIFFDWAGSPKSFGIINENKWHHIAITKDSSSVQYYIDSLPQRSESTVLSFDTNSNNLTIGSDTSGFMSGYIDEPKIYPYARTAEQIKADYNARGGSRGSSVRLGASNATSSLSDGLVGYWSMDETSGTLVEDKSGNGNDGTLTNAQESGTATSDANTTDTVLRDDGGSSDLSTDDDAYNNMTLYITDDATCALSADEQRVISDYDGTNKDITVSTAFSADLDGCDYEIRHQIGGKFGNAGIFDGDDDYVQLSSAYTLTGEFTASAWINHENNSYGNTIFGGTNNFLIGPVNQNSVRVSVEVDVSLTRNISLNTWYLLTVTRNENGIIKVFVNDEDRTLGNYSSSNTHLINKVGNRADLYSETFFNGKLDEVRLYNRALSPAEVQKLYQWAPGPVGWWKMDEGNGSTIYDTSGNNNSSSTFTGNVIWSPGKYGSGTKLDGNNDVIRIPETNSIDAGSNFNSYTLSGWIKTNTNFPNDATIVAKSNSTSAYPFELVINGITNTMKFGAYDGTTWAYAENTSAAAVNDNKWHFVTGVRDAINSSFFLYVDGILIDTSFDNLSNSTGNNADLSIGNSGSSYTSQDYEGIIDDVRIYNYARTPAQIIQDMQGGTPGDPDFMPEPVGHWSFDEGYGTTAHNSGFAAADIEGTLGATIAEPSWTNSGKLAKALYFDGSDYISMGSDSSIDDLEAWTACAWVYPESTPTHIGGILTKHDGSALGNWFLYYNNNNKLISYVDTDTAADAESVSSDTLPLDSWSHVCSSYDDNATSRVISQYINGTKASLATENASGGTRESDASGNMYVGAVTGSEYFFDGKIDEVKLYNVALTEEQVRKDYNQGSSIVLGQTSTESDGVTPSFSADRSYCVPGDTATCDPPVGEWKFDENSGSTVYDTSGSGNDGTWNGTGRHWSPGKVGPGGVFNGSDDYVSAGDKSEHEGMSAYTLQAWVNPQDLPPSNQTLVGKEYVYKLQIYNSGKVRWLTGDGSSWDTIINSDSSLVEDTWYHLVGVLDGTNKMMYVNGQLQSETAASSSVGTNSDSFFIGARSTSLENFDGYIDHVTLFDYARTPAQVAWDYNKGKPIARWKFDETEGTTAYDTSGNGNHGTLQNSPTWVSGKLNNAISFDGTGDSVEYSSLASTSKNVSLTAWVKAASIEASGGTVISIGNYIYILLESLRTAGWFYDGTSLRATGPNVAYTDNQWHYYAYTFDGDNNLQRFFIDGDLVSTNTNESQIQYSGLGSVTSIGSDANGGTTSNLGGIVDDVRIYNYALTPTQVKSVMNDGAVRF
jgi:hypothetical protein